MTTSSLDDSGEIQQEIRRALDEQIQMPWRARRLHGDASTRVYYRLTTALGRTVILTVYDGDENQRIRFLASWEALRDHVPLPDVFGHGNHYVLQEDVGEESLSSRLKFNPSSARDFYRSAVELLPRFDDAVPRAATINPPFDSAKFEEELELTMEYFVVRLSNVFDPERLASIRSVFRDLSSALSDHPRRLCHRDFHGENIFIKNTTLFIIDYQDIRFGPDTYDLASLLRDRGVIALLGHDTEFTLLRRYAELISADDQMESRYWESLLQRSLKIMGTFARQAIRGERRHYLDFLPSAAEATRTCIEHLPQYRALLSTFPISLAS